MTAERKVQAITWGATVVLVGLAIARWAQVRLADGQLGPYDLFPLLGLIAFTLMWLHYTSGSVQRLLGAKSGSLKQFFTITSWIVLALILLHPGLFVLRLWIDGLGLPPSSYLGLYPELAAQVALLLGSLSLVAFLAYEFHRKFKEKKWWRFVEYANVAAMFAIFYHALTLGGEISGWFLPLWFAYGIVLLAAIIYNYYQKKKEVAHA